MVVTALNNSLSGGGADRDIDDLFRCAAGTNIRVLRDDLEEDWPIESLGVGDRVVMESGPPARIRAIGQDPDDARDRRDPRSLWPVVIHRDALGPGRPYRDLHVSPRQVATMRVVTNVSVPVIQLVNGSTIDFIRDEAFAYWHLELERHGAVLANGIPVQSHASALRSLEPSSELADDDLFLRGDGDAALLEAIQDVVASRAQTLGWTPSSEIDFYLLTDRGAVAHEIVGHTAFAAVPAGARELRICVPLFKPSWFGIADTRKLGLAMRGLRLVEPAGRKIDVDLDAAGLRGFFHEGERLDRCPHRWTNGDLVVPLRDHVGHEGALLVRLDYDTGALRCWKKTAEDGAS